MSDASSTASTGSATHPPKLYNAFAAVEDALTGAWFWVRRRLGLGRPRQVVPYVGYANDRLAWLSGRVLSNPLRGGPRQANHWWADVFATWQRWATAEAPGVAVEGTLAGRTLRAYTDDEGYFKLEWPLEGSSVNGSLDGGWHVVALRAGGETGPTAAGRILAPPATARFGVISDLDDTVIQTHVTQILTAARLTLVSNVKTRKPLKGVAALYRAFVHGRGVGPVHCSEPLSGAGGVGVGVGAGGNAEGNPIFYVSSSPWNLYDLLVQFLELNDIPPGPLLLRDVGLTRRTATSAGGHWHKLEAAERVMAAYPSLPFVLVGDNGQQDAELYAEAIRRHGRRILAAYIRDVDPIRQTPRDERVAIFASRAEAHGVPMRLVADSADIARHAASIGLIQAAELDDVQVERDRDAVRKGA